MLPRETRQNLASLTLRHSLVDDSAEIRSEDSTFMQERRGIFALTELLKKESHA